MTYIGTCPVCGRRLACISNARTHLRVMSKHNHPLRTACAGGGQPPVGDSVKYLAPGRLASRDGA